MVLGIGGQCGIGIGVGDVESGSQCFFDIESCEIVVVFFINGVSGNIGQFVVEIVCCCG